MAATRTALARVFSNRDLSRIVLAFGCSSFAMWSYAIALGVYAFDASIFILVLLLLLEGPKLRRGVLSLMSSERANEVKLAQSNFLSKSSGRVLAVMHRVGWSLRAIGRRSQQACDGNDHEDACELEGHGRHRHTHNAFRRGSRG